MQQFVGSDEVSTYLVSLQQPIGCPAGNMAVLYYITSKVQFNALRSLT